MFSADIWNRGRRIAQNVWLANLGIHTQLEMCKYACEEFNLKGAKARKFFSMVFDMVRSITEADDIDAVSEH